MYRDLIGELEGHLFGIMSLYVILRIRKTYGFVNVSSTLTPVNMLTHSCQNRP